MKRCPARAASLPELGGLQWVCENTGQCQDVAEEVRALLQEFRLLEQVELSQPENSEHVLLRAHLNSAAWSAWTPGHDTLDLHRRLDHPSSDSPEFTGLREILVALLASPIGMGFASVAALRSHLRVRLNIARAAQKTALAFKTEAAERPEAYWRYDEEHGFLLRPGAPLIDALIAATQPEVTGKLYDFSCYRASEYVILLGLAQEMQTHHPDLLQQLQTQCEQHAIRSGQFHEVFLVEYGSMEDPLPLRFYVPGDRLWFRNPDEASADVTGYEGSWVIYMGQGLFSNFWKRDQPFTLEDKCLEIYFWRSGLYRDAQGEPQMDEALVEAEVARCQSDPVRKQAVLAQMLRMRDAKGVYALGGCIDTTREFPRGVWGRDCELSLPQAAAAR